MIPTEDRARLRRRERDRRLVRLERERFGADFTPRDRDILQLMASGCDTREMASRTGLAVNTIRGHVQNVIELIRPGERLQT